MRGDEPSWENQYDGPEDIRPTCVGMNREITHPDAARNNPPHVRGDEPGGKPFANVPVIIRPTCVGMNRKKADCPNNMGGIRPTCVGVNGTISAIVVHPLKSAPHAWG